MCVCVALGGSPAHGCLNLPAAAAQANPTGRPAAERGEEGGVQACAEEQPHTAGMETGRVTKVEGQRRRPWLAKAAWCGSEAWPPAPGSACCRMPPAPISSHLQRAALRGWHRLEAQQLAVRGSQRRQGTAAAALPLRLARWLLQGRRLLALGNFGVPAQKLQATLACKQRMSTIHEENQASRSGRSLQAGTVTAVAAAAQPPV
jgi:hypothetical protein